MKNFKMSSLLIACSMIFISNTSFAQIPELFTCSTTSYGSFFSGEGLNLASLKDRVLDDCVSAPQVNIGQCFSNLTCDNVTVTYGTVNCSTSSNGLNFTDAAGDIETAKNYATVLCIANPNTNPEDCTANLKCIL